eukprot:4760782-Prorocentrum_lima.AAC.1
MPPRAVPRPRRVRCKPAQPNCAEEHSRGDIHRRFETFFLDNKKQIRLVKARPYHLFLDAELHLGRDRRTMGQP